MNTISDILQQMRLTGGIFLEADFSAPWAVRSHVAPQDCQPFMHLPRQIVAYHLVTAGHCTITLDTGATAALQYGDLVILPRNTPHTLASAPSVPPVCADNLITLDAKGGLAHIAYGGGGEHTRILCGFLGSASENASLTALLPPLLKLSPDDWAASGWIESTLRFALQESKSRQTDTSIALARLAELLFFVAVRRYFALHPQSRSAALSSMQDVLIGRALALLSQRLNERWTTALLAKEVGLSRSSFAERFTRALGEPPMRYVTRLRLEQASTRLLQPAMAISRIACEAGYESESAFNRAFRRMYGAPPAAWRRSRVTAEH